MKEQKIEYKLSQDGSKVTIFGVINVNKVNLIPRKFIPLKNK